MGDSPDADRPDDRAEPSSGAAERAHDQAAIDDIDNPVVLFDGVCNLCNGFVRFIIRNDEAGRYLFAPLQSDVGAALLARHGRSPDQLDTVVLVHEDGYDTKSTAALKIARHLDAPWPVFSPLIVLPRRLRDGVYDLVGRYRYRLFGKQDTCPVPEPAIRDRFANRTLEEPR